MSHGHISAGMSHRRASAVRHVRRNSEVHASLYRQIANHLPGGAVFVVDHALVYLLADGDALAEVGMVPADIEGKTVREVVGADAAEQAEADYRLVLQGQSFEREHAVRGQFFLSRGTPLRGRDDIVQAALVISYDITRRKEVENALKEANFQKDRFLAMVVHEMRGPLTPLLTGIELLKLKMREPDIAAGPHAIMERQVHHLLRLVDDLADHSRLHLGKLRLERRLVNLNDVMSQALDAVSLLLKQKGHALINRLDDESMQLEADPARLVQIFTNLIQNAAKYSPAGSVIEISAQRSSGKIEVEVRDNGDGIPPDQLQSVFEMFTQVPGMTAASSRGMGIGLALVKGLVEAHGGHVSCHSEGLGKGSRFTVQLPC